MHIPIAHLISQKLKKVWVFAELLLFVLVGAQVNVKVAWHAGLAGTLVILVGLLFRSVGTYISLIGTPLNLKERIFCVIAYIPKATVQAAIGAVPLAAGVASGDLILAVAVLSILLTAPLGAIGIIISGDKILDYGERSAYRFKDLRARHGLPHVGERVRSKQFGTVWKIIEEKEVWMDRTSISFPAFLLNTGVRIPLPVRVPEQLCRTVTVRMIRHSKTTGKFSTTGRKFEAILY